MRKFTVSFASTQDTSKSLSKMKFDHFHCNLICFMLIYIVCSCVSSSQLIRLNETSSQQLNDSSVEVKMNTSSNSIDRKVNKLLNTSDPLMKLQQMYYPYAYQPYGYYPQTSYPTGYGYNQQQYPLAYPYSQPYLRGESYYADRMPRQRRINMFGRRSNNRRMQRNRDSTFGAIDVMSDLLNLKLDVGSMLGATGRNMQRNSANRRQRQRSFDYGY